jgi:hypothetical protein
MVHLAHLSLAIEPGAVLLPFLNLTDVTCRLSQVYHLPESRTIPAKRDWRPV